VSEEPRDSDPKPRDTAPPQNPPTPLSHPALWPPRGSVDFGDYSVRDFGAKFLIQVDDFAEIERYRHVNRREAALSDARPAVVMMGDSIIDFWPLDALTVRTRARLINRGIAGQNSSVLLLRFQADVIELAPGAVIILAGTNDLRAYAGDPDAITDGALERLARNLTAMANMAEGRNIAVALSTLPPVGGDLRSVARSPSAIRRVNAWIARFASDRGYPLADYHAALVDGDGLLPLELAEDGIHPNAAGYDRMAPVLIGAVQALTPGFSPTDPSS
jgi:acyl-CoA thioesterase I